MGNKIYYSIYVRIWMLFGCVLVSYDILKNIRTDHAIVLFSGCILSMILIYFADWYLYRIRKRNQPVIRYVLIALICLLSLLYHRF